MERDFETAAPKKAAVKAEEETSERKKDHIDLALLSQMNVQTDQRFYYEPLLSAHPKPLKPQQFLGKDLRVPIWISSMTGGTQLARKINQNLAHACKEFGLGMGLGSCRILLEGNDYFEDFNLRPIMGDDRPFFANLGIAQVEECLSQNKIDQIITLINRLNADGLIVHVNPLQEWLQPEGDKINVPPLETIQRLLEMVDFKIIVKEVGQGMGPQSLRALFQLPLAAIDFAAFGGTNFSKVELLRSKQQQQQIFENVARMGHSAVEMIEFSNDIINELGKNCAVKEVIISGGIKNFLDGFYCLRKMNCSSVYGQGSALLEHAKVSYEKLHEYLQMQVKGLELAEAYLRVR